MVAEKGIVLDMAAEGCAVYEIGMENQRIAFRLVGFSIAVDSRLNNIFRRQIEHFEGGASRAET